MDPIQLAWMVNQNKKKTTMNGTQMIKRSLIGLATIAIRNRIWLQST